MLKIEFSVHMDDDDALADVAVPALLEYCGAVLSGDAGNASNEHYMADNGLTLTITHTAREG